MKNEYCSYHEGRAEEELALAQDATSLEAVKAHATLAELHLEIVYDQASEHDGDGNALEAGDKLGAGTRSTPAPEPRPSWRADRRVDADIHTSG